MNKNILNTDVQEFINAHLNTNITALILKGTNFSSVETKEIIEQIEAKKRCVKKLPSWFSCKNIYYPNKLNIEQTSSEVTAKYKAELINGNSIIDLTGGFGVDCYYFSKQFKKVIYCEINKNLCKIVNHNYKQLHIKNVSSQNGDGLTYLKNTSSLFNWIYIDPSRRHNTKGKVFFLNDCLPNVPDNLEMLFRHSKNIMIKTSPLLDISLGINELKYVKTIHIIAINNEVKELLWILEREFDDDVLVNTVNIKKNKNEYFSFNLEDEKKLESKYSKPLTYLYEPNAAILKAGGFHSTSKLNVFKLQKHSHLYTSEALIDFPGRCFIIESIIPYNKKELKKLGVKKANITTRNFPETVQQIRKKLKINDGGDIYLFFTTNVENKKTVISAKKVN